MTISEKVAYLKGLAEGLTLDPEAKETKMINAIIDVLTDMADELELIDEDLNEVADELEDINDELVAIDEYLFDDEDFDDDFDFFDDDDEDCGCGACGSDDFSLDVDCPACGGEIEISEEDLINGLAICARCGEKLEFEYDDDEEFEEEKE